LRTVYLTDLRNGPGSSHDFPEGQAMAKAVAWRFLNRQVCSTRHSFVDHLDREALRDSVGSG
ncbi:MAG: hypothetical protein ACKO9Q_31160, partial [Pirellula sp.]